MLGQYQKYLETKIGDCFDIKPAGPSPIKADHFREGTQFWLNDTVSIYAMKGAVCRPSARDYEQLFLVTFYIAPGKK